MGMTRRGRVWVTICTLAVVLPPSLWFVARPRVPIEFVGEAPQFEFIYADEFKGKPLVDFKLPGGGRVVYPKKRKSIFLEETDIRRIAGFLLFSGIPERDRLYGNYQIAGEVIPARSSDVDDGRHKSGSFFLQGVPISPVPFATAEEFREVTLILYKLGSERPSGQWKLRLPLGAGIGDSKRSTTKLHLGPLSITLEPRPWPLSTAPLSYRVVSQVPAGKVYLLHLRWIEENPEDYYVILEGKVDAPLLVENASPQQRLTASLTELRPEVLNVRVRRKEEYNVELFLPDGRRIYESSRAQHLSEMGFSMLEFRSKRVLSNDIELQSGDTSLMGIKDGERTFAIGYRAGKVWKEKAVFDTPPTFRDRGSRGGTGYSSP